jgi:Protein of unknown function (DUF5818)
MIMRKHLVILILAVFAFVAVTGTALARGPQEETYKTKSPGGTITGIIMKTDDGLAIKATDGKEYLVQGQDLSAMVGKKVTVTGKISQSPSKKVLTVESVKEAK